MAPGMMNIIGNPNITHWNREYGYHDDDEENEYPIRAVDSGRSASIDISLILNEDDFDDQCRGFDPGYRVILSMPGEALTLSRHIFRVPISEDTLIMINPKLQLVSNGLRGYDLNLRQCLFHGERKLNFFKDYSQASCEEECLANYTKNYCGCVRFDMPS